MTTGLFFFCHAKREDCYSCGDFLNIFADTNFRPFTNSKHTVSALRHDATKPSSECQS